MAEIDLANDPLLASVPVVEGYKVLGGVVLYQKLGQGGMGAVYKGRHVRLDIDVALKVMALPPGIPADQAESFVKRFIREAKTAAAINHPNLVRVTDVNTEAGLYFLVMDYVDGESAAARLKRKGRLPEAEAVEICLGAAEGLAEAHRKGIVHRDVKPDNIMIDKEGRVRVTDLGLAKARSVDEEASGPSLVTGTQVAMGTPHYMSPEQFLSARTVGPAADVWSLGVTLFQLLAGQTPWSDSSVFGLARKIDGEPPPDLRSVREDVSDGVCAIIEKALRKNPAERYADCGQMANALREHLVSLGAGAGGALSDPKAGATQLALVSMAPPPPRTLTLIAKAGLGSGTPATYPRPFGAAANQVPPAFAAGGPPALRPSQAGTAPGSAPVVQPVPSAAGSRGIALPLALGVLALVAIAGGVLAAARLFWGAPIGREETSLDAPAGPPPSAPQATQMRPPETSPAVETGAALSQAPTSPPTASGAIAPLPGAPEAPTAAPAVASDEDEASEVARREAAEARLASLLAAARTFRETDLLEKAREKLAEALELAPESAEVKRALAEVQKEIASRAAVAERAAEYKKWTDKALDLKLAGKYLEAAEAYTKAAEYAPPGSTDATTSAASCMHDHFKTRASAAAESGDLEAAIDLYAKALEYRDAPETRAALANAKRRLDAAREESARKAEAARLSAKAEEAEQAGDLKAALAYYREAARAGADVAGKMARVEARLARSEAAAAAASQAAPGPRSREREVPSDALKLDLGGGVTMELVRIAAGRFMMGSMTGAADERPVHEVTISAPWYLGRFEVTRAQFARFAAETGYRTEAEKDGWAHVWSGAGWERKPGANWRNPGFPQDDRHPVVLVSWNDAKAFCDWLSKRSGLACRLPTEAEWEYACRAGTRTRYSWGDNPDDGGGWANLADLSAKKKYPGWTTFRWDDGHVFTAPVGSFRANAWGLHDMHGNVWEWCADWYQNTYYAKSPGRDPKGPDTGTMRVLRGGSWNDRPETCTSSLRSGNVPSTRLNILGFRVAAFPAAEQ